LNHQSPPAGSYTSWRRAIFEGIGDDGAWLVGWSGFSAGQTDSRSTTWVAMP
jgi:hypothetical protein